MKKKKKMFEKLRSAGRIIVTLGSKPKLEKF